MDSHLNSLRTLRNQYFALVPPRLIRLPPATILAHPIQGQAYLISYLLDEPRFPQPEDGYRRLYWRGVLRELELGLRALQDNGLPGINDEDLEIDDRFYELMARLMVDGASDGGETDPRQSHRTFVYPPLSDPSNSAGSSANQERHITLLEEQTVLQGGTTGLRTWTAALHFAHHLLHHRHILSLPSTSTSKPSPILELGAGTGFLSILLAQLGYGVISTDLGDVLGGGLSPLDRLRHNVALNDLGDRVQVQELNWMDAQRGPADRPRIWSELERSPPHTIIAADVIYDPDLVPPLVTSLSVLLYPSPTPPQAIIAATVRNPTTLDLFVELCARSNLGVAELELPKIDLNNPTFWDSGLDVDVPVRIMRITPRMQTT